MECLGLHNTRKTELHPGHYMTGPKVVIVIDAGRMAGRQYTESPETGHLVTGIFWLPWVLGEMLGWFLILPSCQQMLHMLPST